jgi:hypothetical protein
LSYFVPLRFALLSDARAAILSVAATSALRGTTLTRWARFAARPRSVLGLRACRDCALGFLRSDRGAVRLGLLAGRDGLGRLGCVARGLDGTAMVA